MTLNINDLAQLLDQLRDQQATAGEDAAGGRSDGDLALQALRREFRDALTWNRSQGWRFFPEEGHHWTSDPSGDDVMATVQSMLRELSHVESDPKTRNALGSATKRNNVVSMLRGLPEVRYSGPWDQEEHLLAAPNGVIDLRTGELSPGEPDQRITKAVTVPYDPDAECPRWEKFVAEVFAHDPELPAYVQRLIGYGATGSTREQCFAVLHGEGSNGKSTFLTALRRIFGEHAATVPFDMFTVSSRQRGGPDTEQLVGARLALASETNRSAVLDSAAIKNATGGEEINVNPKYRDPYSFMPQALILLATNYKPIVKEQDHGTWRRIKLIPFTQKFEGARQDTGLEAALREEFPGILAWIVRGAMDWHQHGLQDPQSVRDAVETYRDESDTLSGFLPGRLALTPGRWLSNAEIWAEYQSWAEGEGVDAFRTSPTLSKALIERGKGAVEASKKRGQRGLLGLSKAGDLEAEARRAEVAGAADVFGQPRD